MVLLWIQMWSITCSKNVRILGWWGLLTTNLVSLKLHSQASLSHGPGALITRVPRFHLDILRSSVSITWQYRSIGRITMADEEQPLLGAYAPNQPRLYQRVNPFRGPRIARSRAQLRRFLTSRAGHYSVLLLVLLDVSCIFAGILILSPSWLKKSQ